MLLAVSLPAIAESKNARSSRTASLNVAATRARITASAGSTALNSSRSHVTQPLYSGLLCSRIHSLCFGAAGQEPGSPARAAQSQYSHSATSSTATNVRVAAGVQGTAHQGVEVLGGRRQLRAVALRFRDGQFLETILEVAVFIQGEGSQDTGEHQPGRQRRRGGHRLPQQGNKGIAELVILHQVVPQHGIREAAVQHPDDESVPDGGVPVRGAAVSQLFGKAHDVRSWNVRWEPDSSPDASF